MWDEMVCKITDRDDNLLYVNGNPAVYTSLEDAFADYNSKTFTLENGSMSLPRKLKMLVSEYALTQPVTLEHPQIMTLTTALTIDDRDGYPGCYDPEAETPVVCTITRAFEEGSMITDQFNLTLSNITLDGGSEGDLKPSVNGGIVKVEHDYSRLTLLAGATLRNSSVEGNGAAIWAGANTTVTISGGAITDCAATNGGAVYGDAEEGVGSTVTISGGAITRCTATDGGAVYARGSLTLSGASAAIRGNTAGQNGGGVYVGDGGAFTMNGGNIGTTDPSGAVDANSAAMGSGVYVGAGAAFTMTGGFISGNVAGVEGGGAVNLAENGSVTFSGTPVVFNNTQNGAQSNVVLDRDSNEVIFEGEAGLESGLVGVFVPDDSLEDDKTLYTEHGACGKPFGTFKGSHDNPNVFINDRNQELCGTARSRSDNNIYWLDVVCKLTDEDDVLLYKEMEYTIDDETVRVKTPAIYAELKDAFADAAKTLYRRMDDGYEEIPYDAADAADNAPIKLKVLKDLALAEGIEYNANRQMTFTTAEKDLTDAMQENGDVYVFETARTRDNERAKLTRRGTDESMFTVNTQGTLIVTGLLLNGAKQASEAEGGAFMIKASQAVKLEDTEITGFIAQKGGAIYVKDGATLCLESEDNPARIFGNAATEAGAGIFLEKEATLKLKGSPWFGGTGVDENEDMLSTTLVDGYVEAAGNFVSVAKEEPQPTNGGRAYPDDDNVDGHMLYRQDIYLDGDTDANVPLTSIVMTGNLTVDAGSIWVWAKGDDNTQPNHYYMHEQFAVLDAAFSASSVTKETYNAFRNARADEDTDCEDQYLAGKKGKAMDGHQCIYWVGGFDCILLKLDGYGEPLGEATFKVYKEYTSEMVNIPYQKRRIDVTATSSDGEDATRFPDPENPGEALDKGIVLFGNILPRTYFIKETVFPKIDPEDEADDALRYEPLVALYKLVMDEEGAYTLYVPEVRDGEQEWTEAPTTALSLERINEDGEKETYNADVYTVLNILPMDPMSRKVILRKVDGDDYSALKDAEFTVYYADRHTVVEVPNASGDSVPLKDLKSTDNGAFWVGRLRYGAYYMEETATSDSETYPKPTHYYVFKVDENGVTRMGETAWEDHTTRKLEQSERDADAIP